MSRRASVAEMNSPRSTWEIDIEGQRFPLQPRVSALVNIERYTGHTLYQLVNRAAARSLTLEELTLIVRFLAGPDCPVPALRSPRDIHGLTLPLDPASQADAIATIIRSGVIPAIVAVTLPLMAAVRGALDEHGEFQSGWTLDRLLKTKD